MARNEQMIDAPAGAIFDVLSDPRGYAYWVIGSMEIRDADPAWPAVGSRFHHTVGMGPLKIKDHTVVEKVEHERFLQIEAKTRPLGSARVKLFLEPVDGRTRVTMVEDPANKPTAFVFTPLMHLLIRARNLRSLDRLAELAEGRRPIPGEEAEAPDRVPQGPGTVVNPKTRERRKGISGTVFALATGAFAGATGAMAMSASSNAEMRLRGRDPSYAPAKALGRVLGIKTRGKRRKKMLNAAGHTAMSVGMGVVLGLLDRAGLGRRTAGLALFGVAMSSEVVVVPALGASKPPQRWSKEETALSVLHHGVYVVTTTVAYDRLRERT
jgi:hypothetical protein